MRPSPGLLAPFPILLAFLLPLPEQPAQSDPFVIVSHERGHGSGTHIGQGRILTAAHVVDGFQVIEVRDDLGRAYPASVTFSDKATDVAVLQIEIDPSIRSAEIACRRPVKGEGVRTTGNPRDMELVLVSGRVAGQIRPTKLIPSVIPLDMTVIPGMSGGGLIDWKGRLIGTVSAVMIQPAVSVPLGIGYAVPTTTICPLLKQAGVM